MSRPHEIEDLLRGSSPQVLAAVTRRFGDFADAEDATQEALLAATQQWPRRGTPENPVGWLIHAAALRVIDRARSDSSRREREAAADRRSRGARSTRMVRSHMLARRQAESRSRDRVRLVLPSPRRAASGRVGLGLHRSEGQGWFALRLRGFKFVLLPWKWNSSQTSGPVPDRLVRSGALRWG